MRSLPLACAMSLALAAAAHAERLFPPDPGVLAAEYDERMEEYVAVFQIGGCKTIVSRIYNDHSDRFIQSDASWSGGCPNGLAQGPGVLKLCVKEGNAYMHCPKFELTMKNGVFDGRVDYYPDQNDTTPVTWYYKDGCTNQAEDPDVDLEWCDMRIYRGFQARFGGQSARSR